MSEIILYMSDKYQFVVRLTTNQPTSSTEIIRVQKYFQNSHYTLRYNFIPIHTCKWNGDGQMVFKYRKHNYVRLDIICKNENSSTLDKIGKYIIYLSVSVTVNIHLNIYFVY